MIHQICPFCKSHDVHVVMVLLDDTHVHIACRNCGAAGPRANTKHLAWIKWNAWATPAQMAHDMFTAILLGNAPNPFDDDQVPLLKASTDTLCWVLGHDHNTSFQTNLEAIRAFMRERGYILKEGDDDDDDKPPVHSGGSGEDRG